MKLLLAGAIGAFLATAVMWSGGGYPALAAPVECNGMTITETITLTGSDDIYSIDRSSPAVVLIEALGGNDTIKIPPSSTARYCLDLGDGNDSAQTGLGDDVIVGGAGSDMVAGGPGTDTCVAETVAECESSGPPPSSAPAECSSWEFSETLTLTESDDIFSHDGSKGGTILVRALGGSDQVKIDPASTARYCIDLGGGDDRVQSGPGDDVIIGGEGMDTVAGGAGRDSCFAETVMECENGTEVLKR